MNKNLGPHSKSLTVPLQHQSCPESSQVQMRGSQQQAYMPVPYAGCEQAQEIWAVCPALVV